MTRQSRIEIYQFTGLLVRCLIATATAIALALIVAVGAAEAAGPSGLRIAAPGATHRIEVGVSKSVIVDLPVEADEVIVSAPEVAGTILRTQRRAIVQGQSVGETNIFFLDARGAQIAILDVSVINDSSNLADTIRRVIPGSNIAVDSFAEGVVLSGTAQSTEDIQHAVQIAARFVGDEEQVANVISVQGTQQVMLKVTVAEVQREAARQLGINLSGSVSMGNLATSLINNRGNDSGSVTAERGEFGVSLDAGPVEINATLRALEARSALRRLAEPTLTAMSGQPAEFLVGGEVPILISDGQGGTTTEFRKHGVELSFTPTVRANGVINLTVDTAVSELQSSDGAVTKRSAITTVELHSGTTLAIGGLLEERVRQEFNELPGISRVPILGALFRSRDFVRSQTELVILVTPQLVHPTTADIPLPTDSLRYSGDAEAIFLGHMEALYGVGDGPGAGAYNGAVGFMLD